MTEINWPRLGALLGVLGTELEHKGKPAADVMEGWKAGPRGGPGAGVDELCACAHTAPAHRHDTGPCMFTLALEGGATWACSCQGYEPSGAGADPDRSDEFRREARAAQQHDEQVADARLVEQVAIRMTRRLDMACPPDMSALRNRLTGDFDPETATDALAAGFCPNCWAAGVKYVPLVETEGSSSLRRYSDRCRPCGDFRKAEKIDKPKEIVVGHAASPKRRFTPDELARIIGAAKAAANPKKKGKKAKGRKAA